jgi:hypothetical protein
MLGPGLGAGEGIINIVAALLTSSLNRSSPITPDTGGEPVPDGPNIRAAQAETSLQELTERVDRLVLIVIALFQLLHEKHGMTEEELLKTMEAVDLSDGRADGRVHNIVSKCPQCGRLMSPRHNRCLYCGVVASNVDPFSVVKSSALIASETPDPQPQPWGEEGKGSASAPTVPKDASP